MNPMTILLTGATGFVGRHLVPLALSRGHRIVAPVRDPARAREILPAHERLTLLPVNTLADIEPQGDALIHLAWSDTGNYLAPSNLFDNLEPQFRFLERVIDAGIGNLTLTGTCLEYGLQEGMLPEDAPCQPVTYYGIAKCALHDCARLLAAKQGKAQLKWLRYFYLYGEGQKANSLLPQLRAALTRGDAVFNMSKGDQARDFIHVETAAWNTLICAETADLSGSFNIGNGCPVPVIDLVEAVIRTAGARIDLNRGHYPYPTYEPFHFAADTARLKAVPGIRFDADFVI